MATIPFNTSIIIRCFTTEHMNKLVAQDPELRTRLNTYEAQLQAEIMRMNGGHGSDLAGNPVTTP